MQNVKNSESAETEVVSNVTPLYTAEDARNAKFRFKLALMQLLQRYMFESGTNTVSSAAFLKWCRKRSYSVVVAEDVYREAYSCSPYQFYDYSDRLHNWLLSIPGYHLERTKSGRYNIVRAY